jgi:archaellum component FlaG (FlaF/FlaG flagellin family)
MKKQNIYRLPLAGLAGIALLIMLCGSSGTLKAQAVKKTPVKKDSIAVKDTIADAPVVKKKSYVKNTFEGNYLIDEQTVMVPIQGTFEFDIQHRFGTVNNGTTDLFGIFGGATMRLGFSYVPVSNLQIGFGATNERMQADGNIKYAILKQTKSGSMPVSVTYFGDAAMDTRKKDNTTLFVNTTDRFSFFNQIIIARKFSETLSLQAGVNDSHFNNLEGYLDAAGNVQPILKNDNFGVSVTGRYKISDETALIANYDQPITQNPGNNPHPNISFGIEFKTSGHDFQIFAGNYSSLLPQNNFVYNQNDFKKGQFLIGFNISRLWNF